MRRTDQGESAVGVVVHVDVQLPDERHGLLGAHPFVRGARQPEERDVEDADRTGGRAHQLVVGGEHPPESAVRLDMTECETGPIEEPDESSGLIDDEVLDLVRRQGHGAPPEPCEVGKPGMRADGDPVLLRQGDGRRHHLGIAGVETARDVREIEHRHQLGVASEGVQPERLAHVRIDGGEPTLVDHADHANGDAEGARWCICPSRYDDIVQVHEARGTGAAR